MQRSTSARIRPGAAARIEHIDVFRGQPIGNVEIVLKRLVHAGNHVLHDLGGRIPDPQLFPQIGIEGFEKRLVEIRNGLAFPEASEELIPFYAIQPPLLSSRALLPDPAIANESDWTIAETRLPVQVRANARPLRAN